MGVDVVLLRLELVLETFDLGLELGQLSTAFDDSVKIESKNY